MTFRPGLGCAVGSRMKNEVVVSFRDLQAWQRAIDLAELCFRLSETFPPSERFGLTSQLRRAALSIPSNIAEGHRRSRAGYLHHLTIALGSHAELETQLELAIRLQFVSGEERQVAVRLSQEVGRLIHSLARSLRRLR
jgi:four helix bundle protein